MSQDMDDKRPKTLGVLQTVDLGQEWEKIDEEKTGELEDYVLAGTGGASDKEEQHMIADAKKEELQRLIEFNVYKVVDWRAM